MTNEDAACMISRLKNSLAEYCGLNKNGIRAFDLAIKALEAQDAIDTNVGDTISRQAAINVLADYIRNVDKVYSTGKLSADDCKDAAKSVLDELPSVQSKIVRCKDCCFCNLEYDNDGNQYYLCTVKFDENGFWDEVNAEDFCSFAERKTDGN